MSSSEAKFQITPGADGRATFEMTQDGTTLSTVLDAGGLQSMVDLLAAVRMVMPGSVPAEPARGESQAIVDPAWVSPPYRIPQGRVLILKHPGLGWLHFVFPLDKAQALSELLVAPFEEAPSTPTLN